MLPFDKLGNRIIYSYFIYVLYNYTSHVSQANKTSYRQVVSKISISMVENDISYENICSNRPCFTVSQICMISLTTILLNFEYFVSKIHSQFIMYSLENFNRKQCRKDRFFYPLTTKYVHVDIRRLHLTLKFEWYQTLC